MKGINEYNQRWKNQIDRMLKENTDLEVLKPYYFSLSSSNVQSYSGRKQYLYYIIKFLRFCEKEVKDINFDDYNEFYLQFEDKTPSYKNQIYCAIKNFCNYLLSTNKTKNNFMEYAKPPKLGITYEKEETTKRRKKSFLTDKEIKMISDAIENGVGNNIARSKQKSWQTRDKALIALMLNTGLRCKGIYVLDVSNIDFDEKKITTIEKGDKKREIFLNDHVLELLREWLADRKIKLYHKNDDENALFISKNRTRLSQNSIAEIVKKYSVNIEGKQISPHKLRATFITMAYDVDHDIELARIMAGHSQISTTQLYVRDEDTRLKNGSRLIGQKIANYI